MNRFIEKRGECYALRSIAVQADIQEILRPFKGAISVPLFLKELRTALQIANCIALEPTAGEPVVPKKEFGVELTPKRKAQDVRSDKYLEVCGRALRKPDASSISITYVRSKNRLIPMFERVHAEPEPIKPEQLDPKACRQFVEQLLAFDELEAKREADIEQLLVTLLSHPEIGLLSYVHFFEGYSK